MSLSGHYAISMSLKVVTHGAIHGERHMVKDLGRVNMGNTFVYMLTLSPNVS